ncbi:chemotaxis protein CheD [Thermodesulfobacteriota bacterium]
MNGKLLSRERGTVFLKPAELWIGTEPVEITTLLGSCVAVTMYNKRFGLAAICHATLPEISPDESCNDDTERFKFVRCVIPWMHENFNTRGVKPNEIDVKLFGGATQLTQNNHRFQGHSIGIKNIKLAKELIRQEGLKLSSVNVGGSKGRKIKFISKTGQVLLKYIDNTALHLTVRK